MGFFDRFRGRGARVPLTSDELRRQLFDAVAREDPDALAKLCRTQEAAVLAASPGWTKVPDAFRAPDKLSWYGNGLISLARHLAEHHGRPELIETLSGRGSDNPLVEWQRALVAVEPLMTELRFEQAVEQLRKILGTTEGLRGSGEDLYLPVTCGRLGECLLQLGDSDGARSATERALGRCESTGDRDGIVAYLGNLYEIHRYGGDAGAAASSLDRLAATLDSLDRGSDAARWRRQAAIVRNGEPRCRVVAELDGATYEVAEVFKPRGTVRFLFTRNRMTLRRSTHAVEVGVAAAERGDHAAALASFERARVADAFDPWPTYHAGLALLEQRRYAEAAASYRTTEALAPGWYQCRADAWMAERLATGDIEHGVFAVVRELSDGRLAPAKRARLAEAALRRAELGALYLLHGDALRQLGETEAAIAAYRRGVAIAEEQDVRTRLLVALAGTITDPAERAQRLHEAVALAGNLVAAATAAITLTMVETN